VTAVGVVDVAVVAVAGRRQFSVVSAVGTDREGRLECCGCRHGSGSERCLFKMKTKYKMFCE
jgi:hypothetical protein